MIDRNHDLPITHQAKLLGVSRGTAYYLPRADNSGRMARFDRYTVTI